MTPFDCPNCKGHGYLISAKYECQQRAATHPCSECACSSCGGSGIDPELVEVAARYDDYLGHESFEDMTPGERGWYEGMLAAVVAYWKEQE